MDPPDTPGLTSPTYSPRDATPAILTRRCSSRMSAKSSRRVHADEYEKDLATVDSDLEVSDDEENIAEDENDPEWIP